MGWTSRNLPFEKVGFRCGAAIPAGIAEDRNGPLAVVAFSPKVTFGGQHRPCDATPRRDRHRFRV